MQVFPPQHHHYLPLASLFILNLAQPSVPHTVLFAFLLLLRPSTTQNYCNAAVSIIICPLILLLNIYDCSKCIFMYNSR